MGSGQSSTPPKELARRRATIYRAMARLAVALAQAAREPTASVRARFELTRSASALFDLARRLRADTGNAALPPAWVRATAPVQS
jgi:hypothetical protein